MWVAALHGNDRKNQDLSIKTLHPAVPSAVRKNSGKRDF